MAMELERFWLMPMGLFLDSLTCHQQWLGIEKPEEQTTIYDIIPLAI